jgi:hypothetical protein
MPEKKLVPFRSSEGISYSLILGVKFRLDRKSKMNLDKFSREW